MVVSARNVNSATTQLVTAATVKTSQAYLPGISALDNAAKRLFGCTDSLVQAAKNAANWEKQQQKNEEEKYGLSGAHYKM